MENNKETVILEIEGNPVECEKDVLIKNSDYFSAMFSGGFKESSQKTIKIEGVHLKSFNTILLLLWDGGYVIKREDLHSVLQVACMLQFTAVQLQCEIRISEELCPTICVNIWKTAERLAISPLFIKAKFMALTEFQLICDTKEVLEFSIEDICTYLGHVYLKVDDELVVFQTAMNWFYENQGFLNEGEFTKVIMRLLSSISFSKLNEHDIKEMQTYPGINDNEEIHTVLTCVLDLKRNGINVGTNYSEMQLKRAVHLCNSFSRQRPEVPCVLLQSNFTENPCPGTQGHKRKYMCNKFGDRTVAIYDKFLRKRYWVKLSECTPHEKFFFNADLSALSYEILNNRFHYLFEIGGDKVKDLHGFDLKSYKEFVLLYGGEFVLGGNNWNSNLWIYDILKCKWQRRNILPYERRHFESAIVDHHVYIVGGHGRFRVVQSNMFWYDLKTDQWSPLVLLPAEAHGSLKCCSFLNQLFIAYLSMRRGYFFNKTLRSWRAVEISIEKAVVDRMGYFTLFSDGEFLYIKGQYLIKLRFVDDKLVPLKTVALPSKNDVYEVQSVVCNSLLYTLYKYWDDQFATCYTLEVLNLTNDEVHHVFEKVVENGDVLWTEDQYYCATKYSKLFLCSSYELVRDDICVNELFK